MSDAGVDDTKAGARMERARSDDAALDALLQAAFALHPQEIELSLGRLNSLLDRLGNPHFKLPPVFHVAGTNGKGSTIAFLRACLEASGRRVHVYTSPHLIRFNERVRIAGHIISDDALAELLRELLQRNAGQSITFFELTTALALLAFSREPADACIIEVGMGGRMDATNVIPTPLVTGIAQLGLDHQQWLGATILDIAREKAGIAKSGVPMVVARYPKAVTARIAEVTGVARAPLFVRGADWDVVAYEGALHYRDAAGRITMPLPRLAGAHQVDNAGLAIAMLRAQSVLPIAEAALRAGMGWAEWPARLQRLEPGPLTVLLPAGSQLWLDGGHNPAAARAIAESLTPEMTGGRPVHLVAGMLAPKDARGFFQAFVGRTVGIHTVPIPGHAHHAPAALAKDVADCGLIAAPAADITTALKAIAATADPAHPPLVLITGSLHLAGHALSLNNQTAG